MAAIKAADDIDLGAIADFAGYHLRRASSAFASDFSRALVGTGVRQVLFGIMSVVAANPGINQTMVGRGLGIQRANMVGLINELVDLEFIVRNVSQVDKRASLLELSTKGEAVLADCLNRIRAHEDEMLAEFSKKDRALFIEFLGRVVARER